MAGKKVIIVGAGISGAAAAHELAQHGFEVIVVEARNRIGGRMCTDRHRFAQIVMSYTI